MTQEYFDKAEELIPFKNNFFTTNSKVQLELKTANEISFTYLS